MDTTTHQFIGFPKMARLSREIVITEKIDGTNSSVLITDEGDLFIGSRTRWITPEQDNFGFARWVMGHKEEILTLGPGLHFGEWWGQGIQRRYGINEKRWSLFNVGRWCLNGETPKVISAAGKKQEVLPPCCGLVPLLYQGMFDTNEIDKTLESLRVGGSVAAPGFMDPEGIICYHVAAGVGFKKTLKNDEIPKGLVTE